MTFNKATKHQSEKAKRATQQYSSSGIIPLTVLVRKTSNLYRLVSQRKRLWGFSDNVNNSGTIVDDVLLGGSVCVCVCKVGTEV